MKKVKALTHDELVIIASTVGALEALALSGEIVGYQFTHAVHEDGCTCGTLAVRLRLAHLEGFETILDGRTLVGVCQAFELHMLSLEAKEKADAERQARIEEINRDPEASDRGVLS